MRAIAVFAVILFHAENSIITGGFLGVDVFFVISGYLICFTISNNIKHGSFNFLAFYSRRAKRIFPSLFLVIFTTYVAAFFLLPPSQIIDLSKGMMATVLFFSNILFWLQDGYFLPSTDHMPLIHTWSLSVEEQFYIFMPLLLFYLSRFVFKVKIIFFTMLIIFSLSIAQLASFFTPQASFYLLPFRIWEFCVGAFLAIMFSDKFVDHRSTKTFADEVIAICGFGALFGSFILLDGSQPMPGFLSLLPVGGTALIIWKSGTGTCISRLLAIRPLVSLGLVSYSLYLWHQPVFAIARSVSNTSLNGWQYSTLILIVIILSYVSTYLLENPIRRAGGLFTRPIFVGLSSLIAISFLFVIGILGYSTNGFPRFKYDAATLGLLETAEPSPERSRCHTLKGMNQTYSDACKYFEGSLEVAVLGDSHAVELSYALANFLETKGKSLLHLSYSSCTPFYGESLFRSPNCGDWSTSMLTSIADDVEIKQVVLTYRIASTLYGSHEDAYPELPDIFNDAHRDDVWAHLISMVELLIGAGKQVYLVLQAPELPAHVETLAMKQNSFSGVSHDWWMRRMNYVYENLDVLPDSLIVVDPADVFCEGEYCAYRDADKIYYFDDDHLSVAGATFLVKTLLGPVMMERTGFP